MKPDVIFVLENAVWPALLLDGSGTILRANPAAIKAFGPALEGEAPSLSAIWSGENGMTPEQFLAHWGISPAGTVALKFLVKGGGTGVFSISICSFNKDTEKYFIFQAAPEAAAGSPKSAASEASFAQKQKLDCALQLARTVSLDFNNALTSILGHTSLLLGKAEPDHPWRRSLLGVEKSAQRAAEISNELAAFSRQEMEAPRAAPGNLNAVVGRCADFFRNGTGAAIAWKLQLEKGLFAARFDEAKLQQALMKVLENAVEAVTGGGGQIKVQTRNLTLAEKTQDRDAQLAAGTYVCVEITDTGHGIEAEVLPRIFEPFFTTKGKPHRGLGLALAYGIVSNHGGGLAVSGQPGAGASVRIYLPAEKQLADEGTGAVDNLHGSETVLVVDDEALLLSMTETILTEFGYKILTANNGQKALAILARDDVKADLVLTDLVMPGMSGRELVDRIRQAAPATRILCMSGYGLSADKRPGTPFLKKPFTSRELLAKVKRVINANPGVDE
jgi:two-component system, cell cycle sensor histidine kinase and response regulator CckA